MLRGLSPSAKVQLGVIGLGLAGVFAYAATQGSPPGSVDDDNVRLFGGHDRDPDDDFGLGDESHEFDAYGEREAAYRRALAEEQGAQVHAAERARQQFRDSVLRETHARPGRMLDGVTWTDAGPTMTDDVAAELRPQLDGTITVDNDTLVVAPGTPLTRDEVEVVWGAANEPDGTWSNTGAGWCAAMDEHAVYFRRCAALDTLLGAHAPSRFDFAHDVRIDDAARDVRDKVGPMIVAEAGNSITWRTAGLPRNDALLVTATLDARGRVRTIDTVIPVRDPGALDTVVATIGGDKIATPTANVTVAAAPDGVAIHIARAGR